MKQLKILAGVLLILVAAFPYVVVMIDILWWFVTSHPLIAVWTELKAFVLVFVYSVFAACFGITGAALIDHATSD